PSRILKTPPRSAATIGLMILFMTSMATCWGPAASPAVPGPASRLPLPASRLPLPASLSYLKWPAEHAERGFLHGFAERRMRVYRDADVLRRSTILERLHRFLNQLRHVRPDHVRPEQLAAHYISDVIHVRKIRAHLRVDDYLASFAKRKTQRICINAG